MYFVYILKCQNLCYNFDRKTQGRKFLKQQNDYKSAEFNFKMTSMTITTMNLIEPQQRVDSLGKIQRKFSLEEDNKQA